MDKKIFWGDEKSKYLFTSSVIIMLIAHGFCFMNVMYSHDSLGFASIEGYGDMRLGRWLEPFLVHIRLTATPWVMGVISIIYVAMAVVLVSKIFTLGKMQGLSVAILFTTNISLTALFCTYINYADADCLALLLACYSVYAFKEYPKVINIIISAIALTLCLALYQAYICLAIGLFIFLLIFEAINSNNWRDILRIAIYGIKVLFTIILGTIIYILLMHKISHYFGVELYSGYNGPAKLNSLKIQDVINGIPMTYITFRDYFFNITEYNTLTMVRLQWIMVFLFALSLIWYVLIKRQFLGSLVIIIPCVMMLPMGLNAIHLVSFGTMHQLMIFAFCLIYLIPLFFIYKSPNVETIQNKALSRVCFLTRDCIFLLFFCGVIYIGIHNIVYSNGAYLYKQLVYDNTTLHAQTIWKDINSIQGYKEGETPVIFVGDFTSSNIAYNDDSVIGRKYQGILTGASKTSITYPGIERLFFKRILGRRMNIVYDDKEITQNSECLEMPTYPSNGYCKRIGNIIVVKIQDIK